MAQNSGPRAGGHPRRACRSPHVGRPGGRRDADVRRGHRPLRRRARRGGAPASVQERPSARHGGPRQRRLARGGVRRAQRPGAGRPGGPGPPRDAPAREEDDHRAAHHRRRRQRGDALQRGGAGDRRRHVGHPRVAPRIRRPRRAAARGDPRRAGRALRARSHAESARLPRPCRARARNRGPLRPAVVPARHRRPRADHRRAAAGAHLHHRRRTRALPALRRRAASLDITIAPSPAWLRYRLASPRRPPHLERRRHHQPLDARVRAADARVRSRSRARSEHRRAACPRRGGARHARRRGAQARRGRPGDLPTAKGPSRWRG